MKSLWLVSGSLLLAGIVSAQEVPRFTFNAGAGFTQPVGGTSRRLNNGWNFDVGAGVNLHSHIGAMVQFNFNDLGVNSNTLNNLGYPDGSVRLWSLTLNPVVHLNPNGPVDVYFIGGGGLYHFTQEFTQPALQTVFGFDPFFGPFTTQIPVDQVLSSYTVNKPGVNGGMGLSFGTKWKGKVYAEARYHRVIFGDRHVDLVPVTFGFRW